VSTLRRFFSKIVVFCRSSIVK